MFVTVLFSYELFNGPELEREPHCTTGLKFHIEIRRSGKFLHNSENRCFMGIMSFAVRDAIADVL